ncbi:TIGR01777 family oxidoreductase [Litorilinea aerophila]|uniref:TIGR01777 family protein n=1 Tax=Litorilinea aerophila TaxID=1204385 RepID=A0A540V8R7_9CHLR|nr:TIGR01777 family oxidoreductase [Litorilinea aerophila]MCC9078977.1 TIGR01777 family oxidoreductase [Litorilinea aerophila]
MRILITGGSGLIGRALCQALIAEDHQVIVLSRQPGRVSHMPQGVQVVQWDAQSGAGWSSFLEGADAVINLAGESIAAGRWTAERKARIRRSRIQASQAVVDALRQVQKRPQVLLQASAVGYYGPRGDEIVTEDTPPGRDFLAQVCVDWEQSTAPAEELGVRRVILRTGIVLSNDGGAFPRIVLPFRFFAGGPLGSGRQWWPWIHMDDQVGAMRFLLTHPDARGPFNLSAPEPVTNREFARQLGQVMGRPALLPTPAFALKLALGEMSTILLDGQRAVPHRLQEAGYQFRFPTLQPALAQLVG